MVITMVAMVLCFVLGAYTGVKSLQMGLKYQMQMVKGETPELKPVANVIEKHQEIKERQEIKHEAKKLNNVTNEMLNDIFGGD